MSGSATLLPLPRFVSYTSNGAPNAGGYVYTYVPNTTTSSTTWEDVGETIPNANPVPLDANGSCLIYGSGSYSLVTTDSNGNQLPAYSGLSQSPLTTAGIALLAANNVFTGSNTFDEQIIATGGMTGAGPITGMSFQDGTLGLGVNTLTNTRLSKTAAYTVANGDKGSTISLGGGATYALTFNAASGYDANFLALIENEDPSNGKSMAIAGYTAFYLWPGQTMLIYNSNGVWRWLKPDRWVPGAGNGPTIYVNSATGSDTNDGLTTANSLQHITAALSMATGQIDWTANNSVNIQLGYGTALAPVTYTEYVFLTQNLTGANEINFIGNPATPAACVWQPPLTGNQYALQVRDCGIASLNGITFQGSTTGQVGIAVSQYAICDVTNVCFNAFPAGWCMMLQGGGGMNWVPGVCTITGNFNFFMQVINSGSNFNVVPDMTTVTMPNALTFTAFISNVGGGNVSFSSGLAFSGPGSAAGSTGSQYAASKGGYMSLGGTTLPGATAGSVSSPSVVDP